MMQRKLWLFWMISIREMNVDDTCLEKAVSFYNALFYALTVHKDEWLALQERISEQVEKLKKLREEK